MTKSGFKPDRLVSGIYCLTTDRWGGHSEGPYENNNLAFHVGDTTGAVSKNRQLLQQKIQCDHLQWLDQVHGNNCIRADDISASTAPQADACWTDLPNICLAIMTADCVPVALWSGDGTRIGVAHAGWRGLVAGVISSLVAAMAATDKTLYAWIGPAISRNHYQVGGDVALALNSAYPDAIQPDGADGHYLADLPAVAEHQLRDLGVENIQQSRICCYQNADCFSYRRDGATGRMATLIWRA